MITRISTLAVLAALVTPRAVLAADVEDDCWFTDIIAKECRPCAEGPAKASWEWLELDPEEPDRPRLREGTIEKLGIVAELYATREGVQDGGDPAYDEQKGSSDADLEDWLNFLRLLFLLGGELDAYLEAIGLTGGYDGVIENPANGTDVPVFLDLQHKSGEVHGELVVLERGLVLDGGICGEIEVPVSVIPVHASPSSSTHASGSTTRHVDLGWFFGGDLTVAFDLTLDPMDRRAMSGNVTLTAPWPCANGSLSGRFERRNEDLY